MVNSLSLLAAFGASTGGVSLYSAINRILWAMEETARTKAGGNAEVLVINVTCPEPVCPEPVCDCPALTGTWVPLVAACCCFIGLCVLVVGVLVGGARERKRAGTVAAESLVESEAPSPKSARVPLAKPPRGRRVKKLDLDW